MIVTSFFGMNVRIPFQGGKFTYAYILVITGGTMGLLWYYFSRKKWL